MCIDEKFIFALFPYKLSVLSFVDKIVFNDLKNLVSIINRPAFFCWISIQNLVHNPFEFINVRRHILTPLLTLSVFAPLRYAFIFSVGVSVVQFVFSKYARNFSAYGSRSA